MGFRQADNKDKDKERQKTMIALTRAHDATVRLDSSLDIEKETALFIVTVSGAGALYTKLTTSDFGMASRVYKFLSAKVEKGEDLTESLEQFNAYFNGKEVA